MKKSKKIIFICVISGFLSACSGFFDKDNTPTPSPLVTFPAEVKVQSKWYTKTGVGAGKDYLKLVPAVADQYIYTADKNGKIIATYKLTGKTQWQVSIQEPISAGPTAKDGLILVGTREGDVLALTQTNGNLLWKARASSEILAAPIINNGIVLVKAIDGQLSAFNAPDGKVLWHYQQTEPALILRGSSTPQLSHDMVVAGFANGNLAKLTLQNGSLQWQTTIARPEGSFAIQRMIDIDADPIVFHNNVYAATYQGHIAALDLQSGRETWTHDISSYTGMAADNDKIFVSDAKSHIWAFSRENGTVAWRQSKLESRNITGPVTMGNYIVVGDGEGYLHWLSKTDGHLVARIRVNHSSILATPTVDNNILYTVTTDGHLAAYTLR